MRKKRIETVSYIQFREVQCRQIQLKATLLMKAIKTKINIQFYNISTIVIVYFINELGVL